MAAFPTRSLAITFGIVVTLFLLLAIPAAEPAIPAATSTGRPFLWNQDSLWHSLERGFLAARAAGCADSATVNGDLAELDGLIATVRTAPLPPTAPILDSLERRYFALAPHAAACANLLERYVASYSAMRNAIKSQSRGWDVNAPEARDRLYRALYGGRAAVEEVMLQHGERAVTLVAGTNEPSATPVALSHGVALRSGDMLVSRGGFPTSALIARGNDYPGNFSHIGLVHIDEATKEISVIEAHIELGVAIASAEAYLADKKLRVMVLRPRADLPQLQREPMLPHRAASSMRDRARTEHVPYDFDMDYQDPTKLFCSEVASSAYHDQGLDLWTGISTISSAGLRRWLGGFGVTHFETQEPSDLEYDPQLVVVAEWRDPALLFDDHISNAVTDVMLEGAERGDELRATWYKLPLARLAKGYGWVVGHFGRRGPIPEGMTASAALRNQDYSARHAALTLRVRDAADGWRAEHGYPPAYWTLVELAREAATPADRPDATP